MFKQILIILILIILTYFIVNTIIIKTHKIFIENNKIKYSLSKRDLEHLKKYSKKSNIKDIYNIVFYTDKKWSTKNNNHVKYKDRYYIIEPGYYYYLNKECKLFFTDLSVNYYYLKKINV